MSRLFRRILLLAATTVIAGAAAAEPVASRWTYRDDVQSDLPSVLRGIESRTGHRLSDADFSLTEDRELAYSRYRRYDQLVEGERVEGMSIRVWTRGGGDEGLLQVEARFEPHAAALATLTALRARSLGGLDTRAARGAALALVRASDDPAVRGVTEESVWSEGRLVRIVRIKARRGTHEVRVDLLDGAVLGKRYRPFATLGGGSDGEYFDVPALVYPIYEEWNGTRLERRPVLLRHLSSRIQAPAPDQDLFAPLRDRRYVYSKHDPALGETEEGQARGYWSANWLRRRAAELTAQVPAMDNALGTGQTVLHGRYATVSIHPGAFAAFPSVTLPRRFGPQFVFQWQELPPESPDREADWEVVPTGAFFGKMLTDENDALRRDATRHPSHDAAFYMDSGFDEVQVYYGVNQMFDSLRPKGFIDPELGERPFHAFLFDPDVESKDNAYYDSDTITFALYSANGQNYARDNTTIWHELGHGVMDRLMGTRLQLADTGGLSEGMADFIAALVLRDVQGDEPFPGSDEMRIVNEIGFFLTNEVHDDGEAYGGAMKAILDQAIEHFGRPGLHMVADLILEAMRLSRDHPGLTAHDWFERMRLADDLGRPGVREAGQLRELIDAALASRNFLPEDARASFSVRYQDKDVSSGELGSREQEVRLELGAQAEHRETISVRVTDGAAYRFEWPVEVRVFFNSGPLQGAIDWVDEDAEPKVYTVAASGDSIDIPLTVRGSCDAINRSDGSCSDFAYLQVWSAGATRPSAKKRFYLRIKTL
jgi:hypothetical protein